MKVEYTYEVMVTVDEDQGEAVEKALRVASKQFDPSAAVNETDAVEIDEDETEED